VTFKLTCVKSSHVRSWKHYFVGLQMKFFNDRRYKLHQDMEDQSLAFLAMFAKL
jgi:hypothetical protein